MERLNLNKLYEEAKKPKWYDWLVIMIVIAVITTATVLALWEIFNG